MTTSVVGNDADLAALRALTDAARRVEEAYSQLKSGASRLDRELALANLRLEQKVVELEHLSGSLAAVLSAMPSGVVVADRDGVVIMANPAAQRILGVSASRLLGVPATELMGTDGDRLLLLSRGECENVERVLPSAEGDRHVFGSVVAVKDAAGQFLGRVELLDDRTEFKALQDEVRRLDRLAELGRVAAILAHEIRNPLSGIRGFAGMLERKLRDGNGREEELRYAKRVIEGAERADEIIDSVLFLANPRPPRREAIELEGFLCDAWECVAQADPQRARGTCVALTVVPDGLTVLADRVRLRQAVSNLMHNALEAIGGKGRIEARAEVVPHGIAIRIKDDGPGIDAETRARVFEPFYSTKQEGAGLGLALVKRIAELHGGTISVDSQIGHGATFTLTLPAEARLTEIACP